MHRPGRNHVLGVNEPMVPEIRLVVRARADTVAARPVIFDPELVALLRVTMEFEHTPRCMPDIVRIR